MKTNVLPAILATWMTLLAVAPLGAQQYPEIASIDYIVALADQVFVGRVARIGIAELDRYGETHAPVVFAVGETLKGDQIQGDHNLPAAQWVNLYGGVIAFPPQSHRLLIAVQHGSVTSAPRIFAIDLDSDQLAVVRGDLAVLNSSAEVIQAARDEVARLPEGIQQIDYDVKKSTDFNVKGNPFYMCLVLFPTDRQLEATAQAALSGPKEERLLAVNALLHFKSDKNINLLKGLLDNDPDNSVRQDAYNVLHNWWKLDVTKPVAGR